MRVSDGALWLLIMLLPAATPVTSSARIQVSDGSVGALDSLKFKTGWVLIGTLAENGKGWLGNVTLFEQVSSNDKRRKPILPAIGDTIRFDQAAMIIIVDYKVHGEERRLESPLSPTHRGIQMADRTDLLIKAGTPLKIEALAIYPRSRAPKSVWARVSPAS
jgi:hypothetical protein